MGDTEDRKVEMKKMIPQSIHPESTNSLGIFTKVGENHLDPGWSSESPECFKYLFFFSFPNIPRVFCPFSRGHSSLYAVFRPEGGLLLFSVQCKKVAMDYKKGKPKAF